MFDLLSYHFLKVASGVVLKKIFLKNFAMSCWSLFYIKLQLYLKETPTQVFSFQYCEIFKNTYGEEHLRMAASGFQGKRVRRKKRRVAKTTLYYSKGIIQKVKRCS